MVYMCPQSYKWGSEWSTKLQINLHMNFIIQIWTKQSNLIRYKWALQSAPLATIRANLKYHLILGLFSSQIERNDMPLDVFYVLRILLPTIKSLVAVIFYKSNLDPSYQLKIRVKISEFVEVDNSNWLL